MRDIPDFGYVTRFIYKSTEIIIIKNIFEIKKVGKTFIKAIKTDILMEGTNLIDFISKNLKDVIIKDGDIIVISSKIVSLSEGRLVNLKNVQVSEVGKALAVEFCINEKFAQLIKEEKVVGVGECGLDYFHNNEEWQKEKQRENFKKQIEFAKEFNKPLVLHLRSQKDFDAYQEALEILDFYGFNDKSERSGIVHFFSANNIKIAENFIRKGFYIAFPGIITFNDFYDKLIMDLPIQKLLVETDSPYVAPVPMRGKRNEPIFVEYTAQKIAQIKNISLEKLAEETVKNTKEVFNI